MCPHCNDCSLLYDISRESGMCKNCRNKYIPGYINESQHVKYLKLRKMKK